MTLAALCVTASLGAVDLQIDAATVGEALANLGPSVGRRLTADEGVAREIVALRLRQVDPKEALERLAEGVNATWKADGDALRLVRTAEQSGAERAEAVAWLARRLAELRRRMQKDAGLVPPFRADETVRAMKRAWAIERDEEAPDRFYAASSADAMLPIRRLGAEINLALDPEVLARLPYRDRVVFSNTPNARQRPLSPAMAQALRAYESRRAALAESAARLKLRPPATGPRIQDRIVDLRPERRYAFRLWVQRQEDGVHYGTVMVDAQGAFLLGGGDDTLRYPSAPTPDVAAPKDEPKLDAEPRMMAWSFQEGFNRLPEPLRAEMLHPERNEPLRDVGHHLVRCAAARKENLVAVLGDRMFLAVPRGAEPPGAYLNRLGEHLHRAREAGGWLFVHPVEAARARRDRMDRRLWGEWIRLADSKPELTLADQFRLSPRVPLVEEDRFPALLVALATGKPSEWNYPALRVVALMPPALRNAGPVPLNRLTGLARETALRRLENSEGFGAFDAPGAYAAYGLWQKQGILDVTDLLTPANLRALTVETREHASPLPRAPGETLPRRGIGLFVGFDARMGVALGFLGLDDLGNAVPARPTLPVNGGGGD